MAQGNPKFLMNSVFELAQRLNQFRLSDAEIGLFCAVVIITAGMTFYNCRIFKADNSFFDFFSRSTWPAQPRVGSEDAEQAEDGVKQHLAAAAPRARLHLLRADDHDPRPSHAQHAAHREVPAAVQGEQRTDLGRSGRGSHCRLQEATATAGLWRSAAAAAATTTRTAATLMGS